MAPDGSIVMNDDNGDGIKIVTQTTANSQPELTVTKEERQLDMIFRAIIIIIIIIMPAI